MSSEEMICAITEIYSLRGIEIARGELELCSQEELQEIFDNCGDD